MELVGLALLGVGAGLGWALSSAYGGGRGSGGEPQSFEVHAGPLEYVNPLLECEVGEQLIGREIARFKGVIVTTIEELRRGLPGLHAAVYYRDLNNGPWLGVNEHATFTPASLLKVPLLMSYLRHAEENPALLSESVYFGGPVDPTQNIVPDVRLEPGQTYTVEELMSRMIVYSDNDSTGLLERNPSVDGRRVYRDLRLPVPAVDFPVGGYQISVKSYASFFRILYNASYLSKADSNRALQLLAQSTYRDGLVAGVPEGVVVAHKYGERMNDRQRQLHDCGVVYHPMRPYLLCVMTRGADLRSLAKVIAALSRVVYEQVDAQAKPAS